MFINVFARALQWCLFWARWVQSVLSHHISPLSISILSSHLCLGLPSGIVPSDFLAKILYRTHPLPHACYMLCQFHAPWLDNPNYIWRRLQVMKLLIIDFFSKLLLFHPSKYSPQHLLFNTAEIFCTDREEYPWLLGNNKSTVKVLNLTSFYNITNAEMLFFGTNFYCRKMQEYNMYATSLSTFTLFLQTYINTFGA
jgi:hypothetical protein